MRKVYPYSLRPIVIFTAILGLIWAVVMGAEEIRDMGSDNGEWARHAAHIAHLQKPGA
jgi:hypothetical protein